MHSLADNLAQGYAAEVATTTCVTELYVTDVNDINAAGPAFGSTMG